MKKDITRMPNCGFSTLELLIAIFVMTTSMVAIISVAFGNQSLAIDTELAQRALNIVQTELEKASATMKADFDAVTNEFSISPYSDAFAAQLIVTDISECAKRVASQASWNRDQRNLANSLSLIEVSPEISAAIGHDCVAEEFYSWESSKFYSNSELFAPNSVANDIDVNKNNKGTFAIIGSNKSENDETLWVIDVTNPNEPELVVAYDTGHNINALDAYSDGNLTFVYLATASTTAQLQLILIDFSLYPTNDPTVSRVAQAQLPGVSGSEPAGRAVVYFDKKVYVGNRRTVGPEFHIFNNSSSNSLSHLSSLELNHSVTDIAIRDNNAFIAATAQTAQGCELIVINVSLPASLSNPCTPLSSDGAMNYRAPGNFGATQVEVLGKQVYLGRQRAASNNDFYILSINDLNAITPLGSINLGINSGTEVTGLKINANQAFISTSDQTPANGGGPFLVYDISNPANITPVDNCNLNFTEKTTGLDIYNNNAYVTTEVDTALRILYSSPLCS